MKDQCYLIFQKAEIPLCIVVLHFSKEILLFITEILPHFFDYCTYNMLKQLNQAFLIYCAFCWTLHLLKLVLKIQYWNFSDIQFFSLQRKFDNSSEIYYAAKYLHSSDIDKAIKYLLFLASCLLLRPNTTKLGFKMLNFIHHHKMTLLKKYQIHFKLWISPFPFFPRCFFFYYKPVILLIAIIIVLNYSGRKGMFKDLYYNYKKWEVHLFPTIQIDMLLLKFKYPMTLRKIINPSSEDLRSYGIFYSKFERDHRHLTHPYLRQSSSSCFSLHVQRKWKAGTK